MERTFEELVVRQREIDAQIAVCEDASKEAQLKREYDANKREMELMNQVEFNKNNKREVAENKGEILREALKSVRDRQKREIVFSGSSNSIENSGAINLTINQLIPTLNEGLGLPAGITIQTGVIGNELWPVSVNDAEAQEAGENDSLNDNNLDFDKITPLVKRVGVLVDVSNRAIDNAAFDVLGFVQNKITLAQKKYLAKKIYSQYPWGSTNIAGPFSGATIDSAHTITTATDNVYAKLLEAVAKFADKGFDLSKFAMVMDAATEAKLKATPVSSTGAGGFIIENGKCAGYDYVVSHYINTKAKGGSGADKDDFVTSTDKFIGMGCWDYLAVQQHGEVRMTQDNSSKAMAQVNKTNFTLNTEWSITDLSVKINTKGGTTTQAFALYKLA